MDVLQRLLTNHASRLAFVDAQAAAGLEKGALLSRACNAFISDVGRSRGVTVDVAKQATEAVVKGPWTPEQRLAIASSLADAEAIACGAQTGNKRSEQQRPSIETLLKIHGICCSTRISPCSRRSNVCRRTRMQSVCPVHIFPC